MRFVDSPVPVVRRTPRELFIIGVAAATAINSQRLHHDLGNTLAFAAIALGFATRFFATRVIATAVAVAAAGLHVAYAWRSGGDASELLGVAYFLGAILVLGGRALVTAFDDAPWPPPRNGAHGLGETGARLNFWRDLPRPDRRRLAFLVHGVALTLAMLYYVRYQLVLANQAVPIWLTAGLVGLAVVGLLLHFGRAFAAFVAVVGGTPLAVIVLAHAPMAWSVARGEYVSLAVPATARLAPQLLLGAGLAAALTVAAAAPWAWRLIRMSALRRS
jgi:hypothetical protein